MFNEGEGVVVVVGGLGGGSEGFEGGVAFVAEFAFVEEAGGAG